MEQHKHTHTHTNWRINEEGAAKQQRVLTMNGIVLLKMMFQMMLDGFKRQIFVFIWFGFYSIGRAVL